MRLIARVRWIGVVFGLLMAFAFTPVSRPAVLAVTVVMSLYNTVAFAAAPRLSERTLRWFPAALLALDFLAVTSWVYLLANDQYSTSYVVFALVGIEAAVAFSLLGASVFAAAFIAALALLQPVRLIYFGFPIEWNSFAFRGGVVLLLVLFAGLIVRQSESRGQRAEDDAARLRVLSQLSMRLGRVLSSHELAGAIVRELDSLYPGAWNAVLLRAGELWRVVAASDATTNDIVPTAELEAAIQQAVPLDLGEARLGEEHRRLRSGHAAPVEGASGVFGLIVSGRTAPGRYAPGDRDLLVAIAGQVAVFQENAWLHETVQTMAELDPLTGLPNRRKFEERLDEEILRHQRSQLPLSLVYIDIDHFKDFNDEHGHVAGDRLLIAFTNLIQKDRRAVDRFYRIGGEEFALLLPDTAGAGAKTAAERLRVKVAEHEFSFMDDANFRMTVSAGCATTYSSSIDRAVDLMTAADDAMYAAKRGGRNQVRVTLEETAG
jgi:diguanylate cyclase (GGDEF)-like protein